MAVNDGRGETDKVHQINDVTLRMIGNPYFTVKLILRYFKDTPVLKYILHIILFDRKINCETLYNIIPASVWTEIFHNKAVQ